MGAVVRAARVKLFVLVAAMLAGVTAACTPVKPPIPPVPAADLQAATTYLENAAHDGRSSSSLSPTATLRWSRDLGGPVSYPVIASGRAFVTTSHADGTFGNTLWALNAKTGQSLWGPIAIPTWQHHGLLAYDAGRVFFQSADGSVQARDAATGTLLWKNALVSLTVISLCKS